MMAEQILRLVVGLGVGVWTARVLGPSLFGELSYAIAFATVFGIVATLGMNRIVVRELVAVSDNAAAARRLMDTAFAMRLAAAVVVYVACLVAGWFGGQRDFALIALVAGSFFFSASDVVELYFQAKVQARTTARYRLVPFLLVTACRATLLLSGAGVISFAAVSLVESIGTACALQWAYRRQGLSFLQNFRPDWQIARRLLVESWPEIIAGFSGLLFVRLDQIMLQYLAGPETVGAFAVAVRLSEVWYFIPTAIIASTFPNIIAARAVSQALYMKRMQSLMTLLCALSYCAAVLVTALADPVVRWLYGGAYAESADILKVHIWSGLFVSLGLASGSWIMAEKRVALNLYRNLTGLLANIFLNLSLIPRFGALGAAYATLSSLVIAYILFDHLIPSMREISRRKWKAMLLVPAILK
jgi:PST family polysaccharide transporter